MTTARLRRLVVVASPAVVLGAFVACAESEVALGPRDAGPLPDAPSLLPEAAPEPGDAANEAEDAAVPHPGRCSGDGFCLTPVPIKAQLAAVSASSMDDAWAIDPNVLIRWDGESWKTVRQSAKGSPYQAIHVVKHDDVWVLGQSGLVRYSSRDGGPPTFREYPNSIHPGIGRPGRSWVNAASNELVIFSEGSTYKYREESDGSLSEDPIPGSAIPWTTKDALFVVRTSFFFDWNDFYVGGSWCSLGNCNSTPATQVPGAIAHYDGSGWSIVTTFDPGEQVYGIYGTTGGGAGRQLWLWTTMESRADGALRLVSLAEDGGVAAPVLTYPVHTYRPNCRIFSGSVADSTAAWFSNGCFVYRWNGTEVETIATTPTGGDPLGPITGVWAGSVEDAWIVGNYGVDGWSGTWGFAAERTGGTP